MASRRRSLSRASLLVALDHFLDRDLKRSESRNRLLRQPHPFRRELDSQARVADRLRGGKCRTRSGERIEDDALAERQDGTDDLSQERLWLQRGVRRERALGFLRPTRSDHISKRPPACRSA